VVSLARSDRRQRSLDRHEERTMYIGIGTVVLIIVILLLLRAFGAF
jgi:hypothetical protein